MYPPYHALPVDLNSPEAQKVFAEFDAGLYTDFAVMPPEQRAYEIGRLLGVEDADAPGSSATKTQDLKKSNIKLYRVMSQDEFSTLVEKQQFLPYDMAMEDKWLATSPENARKWAEWFYPDHNYKLVELEIDADGLNKMFYSPNLDNIGPAYCSPIDVLNQFLKSMREVK